MGVAQRLVLTHKYNPGWHYNHTVEMVHHSGYLTKHGTGCLLDKIESRAKSLFSPFHLNLHVYLAISDSHSL
jgi:hypothetical protein